MKKLITTAFLLIALANASYGQDVETINYASGDVYIGEMEGGRRNGQGVYISANGNTYDGGWVNDIREGEGTFKYFNGDIYTGGFVDGRRNGLGKMISANGIQYEGFWSEGSYEGEGTYTHSNGVTRTGFWESGELVERTTTPVTIELLKTRLSNYEKNLADELSGDLRNKSLRIEEFLQEISELSKSGNLAAIEWLKRAAELGDAEAQYQLGYNLANGQGISVDIQQAEYWLSQSLESGNARARQELQENLDWTDYEINIVMVLKPKCTNFGFEEGSDGHSNCVMELQIAEEALTQARQLNEELQQEIATTEAAAVARATAARRYQEQQQKEREAVERQRAFGRALLGISAGILNPGRPSNSGNMFQTCNYNVLGEIVPYATSSASICPMSMDFGGVTGTLQ